MSLLRPSVVLLAAGCTRYDVPETGLAEGPASVVVGPIVGAVTQSGAVVRARLDRPGAAELHVTPEGGEPFVVTGEATEESGSSVGFALDGLSPDTAHTYEVRLPRGSSAPRTFRTAPPPDDARALTFAVFADAKHNPAPAYAAAAAFAPDLALQIGDIDHADPGDDLDAGVDAWRAMYRTVLRDSRHGEDLDGALLATTPLLHMWDDHDYGDNDGDRFAPWRAASRQAFDEAFPLPALPNADGGLWHAVRWGRAELFLLDLRSQRDPESFAAASRSMLDGERLAEGQLDWLIDAMTTSDATWKLLVSTSCWSPGCDKPSDSWNAYRAEQDVLVAALNEAGVTGVVVISGDIHSGGAIDDGTNALFPELSVPTTNADADACTTLNTCGTWSEGVVDPAETDAQGFALVTLAHDDATGADTCTLQVRDAAGAERISLTLEAPG